MASFTYLDDLKLTKALDKYAVGELVSAKVASEGIENSNYFVTTAVAGARDHYVLTVLEQPPYAGVVAYETLMDTCIAAGLPVPRIVRNQIGEAFDTFEGKPLLLSCRLVGQHTFNPTQSQIQQLGRVLARFHRTTRSLALPDYPRDIAWLATKRAQCRSVIAYSKQSLVDDALLTTNNLLERQDVANLPRGVIHGDLFRDNVLFNEHGLTGLLDFHHAANGFWVYDLAVAANDWCSDDQGVLNTDRVLTLLRAYHHERALTEHELWLFPNFTIYAALSFFLSRQAAVLAGDDNARVKNPEEFARILARRINRFLYLNPRMLD